MKGAAIEANFRREKTNVSEESFQFICQAQHSKGTPGKYTMEVRGAKTVPVKDIDYKRQIAETYFISMSGKFLPIQLIYRDKTKRCLPK